ncbi:MAG: DUF3307 domain-containing protein [Nibricoccus sp.]
MITSSQIDLGLALLAAHLMTDFVLQPDWMVKRKERRSVLFLHSLIGAALTYAFVGRWELWVVPAWVFLSHAAIDYVKVRAGRNSSTAFWLDQTAHVIVVAILTYFFATPDPVSHWYKLHGRAIWSWWILLVGAILCVRVGGILVGFWVKPYLEEIERANREAGVAVKAVRGLTNGGRVIGQLERVLIFMLVGLGQLGGIGFLVAAKSIFRFGELKDRENRMEAEYITIGTLISFSWAVATSVLTWWLARAL